jgi:hypothetical protein
MANGELAINPEIDDPRGIDRGMAIAPEMNVLATSEPEMSGHETTALAEIDLSGIGPLLIGLPTSAHATWSGDRKDGVMVAATDGDQPRCCSGCWIPTTTGICRRRNWPKSRKNSRTWTATTMASLIRPSCWDLRLRHPKSVDVIAAVSEGENGGTIYHAMLRRVVKKLVARAKGPGSLPQKVVTVVPMQEPVAAPSFSGWTEMATES